MTYEQADFNAHVMAQIIRETISNGGTARHIVDAMDPEVIALLKCKLTHGEKTICGLAEDDEPDRIEAKLRRIAIERERQRERDLVAA